MEVQFKRRKIMWEIADAGHFESGSMDVFDNQQDNSIAPSAEFSRQRDLVKRKPIFEQGRQLGVGDYLLSICNLGKTPLPKCIGNPGFERVLFSLIGCCEIVLLSAGERQPSPGTANRFSICKRAMPSSGARHGSASYLRVSKVQSESLGA